MDERDDERLEELVDMYDMAGVVESLAVLAERRAADSRANWTPGSAWARWAIILSASATALRRASTV